MALFSGGYLFVLSNYRQTTSFKNPHSHLYSKHLRSLNLDFAFHQKARISNTIESGNTKNCAAPVADMNGFQLRCHLQSDLPHDTVSKYQVLHTTPSLSSTPFSDSGGCNEPSLRVAHQGIRGAYSESAAEKAYPNCETIACQHFHSTFQAVARRVADRAVIPIENSLGGSIHGNYDLLLRHSLHIIGEIRFAVSHCLLANNGVDLHDLKTVLSHPQALAQCEKSLTKLGLEGEAVASTAVAAKKVAAEKLRDTGALASSSAALLYGLNILASNVQMFIAGRWQQRNSISVASQGTPYSFHRYALQEFSMEPRDGTDGGPLHIGNRGEDWEGKDQRSRRFTQKNAAKIKTMSSNYLGLIKRRCFIQKTPLDIHNLQ
ncbi:hypothetical protein E1A91_D09G120800v1 [Gossypium mustelinum]|uniref:Prephenate dehydratase domain-containing protein n=1 Tax=Gossypium mustelinum TaxID=34275 RepID=A0A5D2TKV6_GOSMU|nr:hypothetical protein E1A91_D09G120800v1 [Gossypium mustelinum]